MFLYTVYQKLEGFLYESLTCFVIAEKEEKAVDLARLLKTVAGKPDGSPATFSRVSHATFVHVDWDGSVKEIGAVSEIGDGPFYVSKKAGLYGNVVYSHSARNKFITMRGVSFVQVPKIK